MLEYLKTETDRLLLEKLPVRAVYLDNDTVHCIWVSTPTADHERYVSSEVFPEDRVQFGVTR